MPTSDARLENVVIPDEVRDLQFVLDVSHANIESNSEPGGSRLPDAMIIGVSFFGRCRRHRVNPPAAL